MVTINTQQIKNLRDKTGAGISDVKKTLEKYKGDFERAFAALERKLGADAIKRTGRATQAGMVDAYRHSNGRIGAMVELFCETDFVARNPDFRALAHDIAMHVAAMKPLYRSLEDVPSNLWNAEKEKVALDAQDGKKSAHIIEQIVEGKLKSHFGALSLLSQPFVKSQEKTVETVIKEASGRFGENIKVGRFERFEI